MRQDSRVLVTGAAGWFGRTTLELMCATFGKAWLDERVLPTGSFARTINVLDVGPVRVHAPSDDEIRQFAPTVIVNCAFLTRNLVAEIGHEEYVRRATLLTDRLLWASALPSVERAVTFSSGAAVPSAKFPDDLARNPYGVLKAREEAAFLGLARTTGRPFRVARVWSVSGPHVQRPTAYAFSGFILEALTAGTIQVAADSPVLRRFTAARDVVALSLSQSSDGPGITNSGGPLLELGDLAQRIAGHMGGIEVVRTALNSSIEADDYYPRDEGFGAAAQARGFEVDDIDVQIAEVERALRRTTQVGDHPIAVPNRRRKH